MAQYTEKQIAASVIARLLHERILPYEAAVVARVARLTNVPIAEIKRSYEEQLAYGGWRATDAETTSTIKAKVGRPRKNTAPATAAAQRKAGNTRTENGIEERKCSRCGEWLPATTEHFYLKNPHTGSLTSLCRDCRPEYQRERYLSVEKVEELNKVGLQFVLSDEDRIVGLMCSKCEQQLSPGDLVHGTMADLAHVDCDQDA